MFSSKFEMLSMITSFMPKSLVIHCFIFSLTIISLELWLITWRYLRSNHIKHQEISTFESFLSSDSCRLLRRVYFQRPLSSSCRLWLNGCLYWFPYQIKFITNHSWRCVCWLIPHTGSICSLGIHLARHLQTITPPLRYDCLFQWVSFCILYVPLRQLLVAMSRPHTRPCLINSKHMSRFMSCDCPFCLSVVWEKALNDVLSFDGCICTRR